MKMIGSGNELHLNGVTLCAAVQHWLDEGTRGVEPVAKVTGARYVNGSGTNGTTFIFDLEASPPPKA